jgi:iron complex transport system permease protein
MKLATKKSQLEKPRGSVKALPAPLLMLLLSAVLLIVILLAISFGATPIPVGTIIQVLLNGTHLFHFAQPWYPTGVIVWQVRMPGVFGAVFVGAALGVAGVLFQGMLRNPLADPFLIGTSSGAALGAAIAFVLPLDTVFGTFFPLTPLLAFIGAMLTVLLVYAIARVGSYTPVITLLLAGVVINAVLVAFQTLILTLSPHSAFGVQALFNWLSGGIAVYSWSQVFIVGAIIIAGIIISLFLAGVLDAFGLGEESAANLGLHVERYKLIIIIVGSLLTAAAVSISGLIGFVGLVTPHAMRLILGPRHHLLLPASALGGAIFLTLADLLARIIVAPSVLPVGIFTALVGAPFFLVLLRNNKKEYRW